MQVATNTTPTESLLTAPELAWLDACPVGDSRSLTSCGRTVTVDRRFSLPYQIAPQFIEPRWEITYGTTIGDVICIHPQHNTSTGHRPF